MPGVTLGDGAMYCRFLNHDNDSGAVGAGYDWDETPPDAAALLRERFRIDLARSTPPRATSPCRPRRGPAGGRSEALLTAGVIRLIRPAPGRMPSGTQNRLWS